LYPPDAWSPPRVQQTVPGSTPWDRILYYGSQPRARHQELVPGSTPWDGFLLLATTEAWCNFTTLSQDLPHWDRSGFTDRLTSWMSDRPVPGYAPWDSFLLRGCLSYPSQDRPPALGHGFLLHSPGKPNACPESGPKIVPLGWVFRFENTTRPAPSVKTAPGSSPWDGFVYPC
jgi:hypothetical protein